MSKDNAKHDYGVVPFDFSMIRRGIGGDRYYMRMSDVGEKHHRILNVPTPAKLRRSKWIHLYAVGYLLFADIRETP